MNIELEAAEFIKVSMVAMPSCRISTRVIPATCAWLILIVGTAVYFIFALVNTKIFDKAIMS